MTDKTRYCRGQSLIIMKMYTCYQVVYVYVNDINLFHDSVVNCTVLQPPLRTLPEKYYSKDFLENYSYILIFLTNVFCILTESLTIDSMDALQTQLCIYYIMGKYFKDFLKKS